MPWPTTKRSDDIKDLELLDMHERLGLTARQIGERRGKSKNAIIGKIHRLRSNPATCACVKPENKDGGMPELWWRS